jgi:hypothetical protein
MIVVDQLPGQEQRLAQRLKADFGLCDDTGHHPQLHQVEKA